MKHDSDRNPTWRTRDGIVVTVNDEDLLIRAEPGPCPRDTTIETRDCAALKCSGRVLEHADVVLVSSAHDSAFVLALYRCPGPARKGPIERHRRASS